MADTKRQEEASLVTFYYAINQGSSLEPYDDESLVDAIKSVYPQAFSDNGKWYKTFLKQARVLLAWMGHREGSKDNSYSYCRWGSNSVRGIPGSQYTSIYEDIFDSFSNDQKLLFGKGSGVKDSWNTTDVYICKTREISNIKSQIAETIKNSLSEQIGSSDAAEIEVALINRYLAAQLRNRTLVGISLKETDYGDPKVTETNVGTTFVSDLGQPEATLDTPLHTWMEIVEGKGSSGIDFKGNSMTYRAGFTIGDFNKKYKYESKVSSLMNHATEPRDLVRGARGGLTNARARNGAIPAPKMAKIIKDYSGEDINYNIPRSGFTETQKTYWKNYIKTISSDSTISKTFGNFTIQQGKTTRSYSPEEFLQRAFLIDEGYRAKTTGFPLKLRSKMRLLRYMKAFIKAKKDRRLAELIAEIYFSSSKINMRDGDLSGPFVKIQ
tara:strand:+ start:80 stop:1396 length:1317 start_codon:yes stop_codon:yes gene_type:complete